MRLRHIEHCSFRKSEETNFGEICAKMKLHLKPNEVACLVSLRGDQVIFVWAEDTLKAFGRTVLRSARWRLTNGGTWDPLLIQDYAREVGLRLDGIKLFEEHYKALTEES